MSTLLTHVTSQCSHLNIQDGGVSYLAEGLGPNFSGGGTFVLVQLGLVRVVDKFEDASNKLANTHTIT